MTENNKTSIFGTFIKTFLFTMIVFISVGLIGAMSPAWLLFAVVAIMIALVIAGVVTLVELIFRG